MSKNTNNYAVYEDYDYIWKQLTTKFKNIAMNMFVWDGLPAEIKPRYIEEVLYDKGCLAFGYDREKKLYLALSYAPQSEINLYGEFTTFSLIAFNGGYSKQFEKFGKWAMRDGVVKQLTTETDDIAVEIRNNTMRQATSNIVNIYATKMADTEFTTKMNMDAQKMPYMFMTTQKNQQTLKNMYKKMKAFEPIILADRGKLDAQTLDIQDFNAPYLGDKLHQQFKAYESELLTYLGINNVNMEKQARVQTSEVEANNQYINYNLMAMLETRQEAVEEINEAFGLNVTVDFNIEYISSIYEALQNEAQTQPETQDITEGDE